MDRQFSPVSKKVETFKESHRTITLTTHEVVRTASTLAMRCTLETVYHRAPKSNSCVDWEVSLELRQESSAPTAVLVWKAGDRQPDSRTFGSGLCQSLLETVQSKLREAGKGRTGGPFRPSLPPWVADRFFDKVRDWYRGDKGIKDLLDSYSF